MTLVGGSPCEILPLDYRELPLTRLWKMIIMKIFMCTKWFVWVVCMNPTVHACSFLMRPLELVLYSWQPRNISRYTVQWSSAENYNTAGHKQNHKLLCKVWCALLAYRSYVFLYNSNLLQHSRTLVWQMNMHNHVLLPTWGTALDFVHYGPFL